MKYKITILGPQAAGKTSIAKRWVYDEFLDVESSTIGIDFLSKSLRGFRHQLWDTAGQKRFHGLVPRQVRDAAAVVLVFDGTKTYEEQKADIDFYLGIIKSEIDKLETEAKKLKLYVAVNKVDTDSDVQISKEQLVQVFAAHQTLKIDLVEDDNLFFCSAKENKNIEALFTKIRTDLAPSSSNTVDTSLEDTTPDKGTYSTFHKSPLNYKLPKVILDFLTPTILGLNGFMIGVSITLFTLAAFSVGSFLTFGVLPSAFIGAAIITLGALVVANTFYVAIQYWRKNLFSTKVKNSGQAENSREAMHPLVANKNSDEEALLDLENSPSPLTSSDKNKNGGNPPPMSGNQPNLKN